LRVLEHGIAHVFFELELINVGAFPTVKHFHERRIGADLAQWLDKADRAIRTREARLQKISLKL
jgi:hypothetical protein